MTEVEFWLDLAQLVKVAVLTAAGTWILGQAWRLFCWALGIAWDGGAAKCEDDTA